MLIACFISFSSSRQSHFDPALPQVATRWMAQLATVSGLQGLRLDRFAAE